jgi:TonB family protein
MKRIVAIILFIVTSIPIFSQEDSTARKNEDIEIITVVESMPQFIGGEEALQKYLITNAIYTTSALKDGSSGTVYVTFVIDENGNIVEPRILRGVHHDLDSISLRMIKNMPPWIPAKLRGKPVKYQFNQPVKFTLSQNPGLKTPQPSDYWAKKGKKYFFQKCLEEHNKSQAECDCWYEFILWNYNNYRLDDLDLNMMFEKQKCD